MLTALECFDLHDVFVYIRNYPSSRESGVLIQRLISNLKYLYDENKRLSDTNMTITPKTRRIRETKEKLVFTFHVSEKKRPHWINGAEWPMGKKSPMRFISQSKEGEIVKFTFEDVDTGEQKVVEQFY